MLYGQVSAFVAIEQLLKKRHVRLGRFYIMFGFLSSREGPLIPHAALVESRSIISLRNLYAQDKNLGDCVLDAVFPEFCRVFPFKSEREERDTYRDYLLDPEFPWDNRVLFEQGKPIGGIHYQLLPVFDTCVLFAEHFWLKGNDWFNTEGFRSQDRFEMLGLHLQSVAREAGAPAIVWECNDLHQMSAWERRLDRKAGLPPEKRIKLWGRYGTVLDVQYAQPRLSPELQSVEFLMLCVRLLKKDFQFTGAFYRQMFHNFVRTFNDQPETDECYQRIMSGSRVYEDSTVIPRIKFGAKRTFLNSTTAV